VVTRKLRIYMVLPENEVILEASSRWVYCEFLEDAGLELKMWADSDEPF